MCVLYRPTFSTLFRHEAAIVKNKRLGFSRSVVFFVLCYLTGEIKIFIIRIIRIRNTEQLYGYFAASV